MFMFQVELYNTKTGEVVHGFTIKAADAHTARILYMAQPERPQLVGDLEIRVR